MNILSKKKFLYVCFFPAFLLLVSQSPIKKRAKDKVFTVVIDAGHGGKDPGNIGNGYREKHIALSIALKIGKTLEKEPDIKVIYTRKKDIFIELHDRARIANDAQADLFISIHCDSHHSNAFGAGTFVLGLHENQRNFEIAKRENSVIFLEDNYQQQYDGFDPNNPESIISLVLMQEEYLEQSIEVASIIQHSFVKNLKRKDRTVKQAGFLVLRNTFMPSVLVEAGFLTNRKEGKFLNSAKGQSAMANAIAKAVISYKNKVVKNIGLDIVNEDITDVAEESKRTIRGVTFKVQIAASSKAIDTKPFNFKGLSPISMEKFDKVYRYFYGETSDYNKALLLREEAISSGYPDSFLVAYRGSKKVSVAEALRNDTN